MDHLAGILLLALPSGADDASVPAVVNAVHLLEDPQRRQYPCPWTGPSQLYREVPEMISAPIATCAYQSLPG